MSKLFVQGFSEGGREEKRRLDAPEYLAQNWRKKCFVQQSVQPYIAVIGNVFMTYCVDNDVESIGLLKKSNR